MKQFLVLFLVAFLALVSASAYAVTIPDCNSGGRYEVMGDGTVQDCRTGLIWLQNANCTNSLGGIDKSNGYLNWYDALTWVAALEDSYCGLIDGSTPGDWRLPTRTEWMAMVAYARKMVYSNPALTNAAGTLPWTVNGDAFNNVLVDFYWSSTTYAPYTASVWAVYMSDGLVYNPAKSGSYYVWPVRGGQSGEFGSLIIQ